MMLQPLTSLLREDDIGALNTNEIINSERLPQGSSAQVFVFVFTQSGNGLEVLCSFFLRGAKRKFMLSSAKEQRSK